MIFFSEAQGQLSPQSVVKSGQHSNSSEVICLYCKNEVDPFKNEEARLPTKGLRALCRIFAPPPPPQEAKNQKLLFTSLFGLFYLMSEPSVYISY